MVISKPNPPQAIFAEAGLFARVMMEPGCIEAR
jgi:hypothetical protein